MRNVVLGVFVFAGLALIAATWRSSAGEAYAERPAYGQGARQDLITYVSPVDEQRLLLTVIDPGERVVAIYHVDRNSGTIAPASVRRIQWDLQLEAFNIDETGPSPQQVRSMVLQD